MLKGLAGDVAAHTIETTALVGRKVAVSLASPLRVVEGGGVPVFLERITEAPVTASVDDDGSYQSKHAERKTVEGELRLAPGVAGTSQKLQVLHRGNYKQRPLAPRRLQSSAKQI